MSFFDKIHSSVHKLGSRINERVAAGGDEFHSHTHESGQCSAGTHPHPQHRFLSFAPQREGNDIKWFVDGCGYMWAVSRALEVAEESIWILDWWLSPELYLRRPPSKNQQYRVDRMLHAAAQRGVKVNIIVYKEVTQALTRKYLTPTLPDYLHSFLPSDTDIFTRALTRLGLEATFKSLEFVEESTPLVNPPVTVSSSHTKHALEDLHPNIAVFRHPDHLPDAQVLKSSFLSAIQNMSLTAANASKLPADALQALYGAHEGTILYWAHHEKLCIVDGQIAFMGGLDLCYGRWDTNQHSIADAHPGGLDLIVFPGQDYNNARVKDFQDVKNWQNNELDRRVSSRMGWSDVSVCLSGPVIDDLKTHFMERWNFIYDEKYSSKNTRDRRYRPIVPSIGHHLEHGQAIGGAVLRSEVREHRHLHHGLGEVREWLSEGGEGGFRDKFRDRYLGYQPPTGDVTCQVTRSSAKWSHGISIEHSIANAYIEIIRDSQHFIYIENQFFITATSDAQRPIKNKIGAAIAERIVRAARNGEKYKMIVMIPSVPAFAGDLRSDESLSTRAVMEFQYFSINRGGHSIMEVIAAEGYNPLDYIRFYNLRNYDRINSSGVMEAAEQISGVSYEQARKQHDYQVGADFGHGNDYSTAGAGGYGGAQAYNLYQAAAEQMGDRGGLASGRWDSVAECYMLGGQDIRTVPWESGKLDEIDAFVSEELYIHSKLLIADDRIVICGSANLNDRSQIGDHDSEIAIVIQDPTPVDSLMNGRPWRASRFAASLRRQLFRKHLGLLKPQDMQRPDSNFEPIGVNAYDWGTPEDVFVADPISDNFLSHWYWRARINTECFAKVFHPVPDDGVRTWKQYGEYYERFFKEDKEKDGTVKKPSLYKWGHVVAEEFSPGEQGLREVKEWLSRIKGTLVEMPLLFLKDEDIAREGLGLNAFTEEVYT